MDYMKAISFQWISLLLNKSNFINLLLGNTYLCFGTHLCISLSKTVLNRFTDIRTKALNHGNRYLMKVNRFFLRKFSFCDFFLLITMCFFRTIYAFCMKMFNFDVLKLIWQLSDLNEMHFVDLISCIYIILNFRISS